LKGEEKEQIMADFKSGNIDILVTTTVIEVGVDVPNANVIIIEHAERFGLSQLHQLRGRVGRGKYKSFCILIYPESITEESKKRISTLVATNDGFEIAEEDLKQRGAGELIGTRQHGHSGSFEFTDLEKDYQLILQAREEAANLVNSINSPEAVYEDFENNIFDPALKGIRKKRILATLS
jgi:ATP-dependent DNA helicase RecG